MAASAAIKKDVLYQPAPGSVVVASGARGTHFRSPFSANDPIVVSDDYQTRPTQLRKDLLPSHASSGSDWSKLAMWKEMMHVASDLNSMDRTQSFVDIMNAMAWPIENSPKIVDSFSAISGYGPGAMYPGCFISGSRLDELGQQTINTRQSAPASLVLDYRVLLDSLLVSRGFVLQPDYSDDLGATILDSFRGMDRVTLAISARSAQILIFVDDNFKDRLFPNPALSKISVAKYLDALFI
jgi:hypothetical protein